MAAQVDGLIAAAGVATEAVAKAMAPVRPKNSNKVRKRAPKACLSCRARKVRCDVSQRGRPCMNCYLDSETCVVTGRASRLRKAQPSISETAVPANGAGMATGIHSHNHQHDYQHDHQHDHPHDHHAFPALDAASQPPAKVTAPTPNGDRRFNNNRPSPSLQSHDGQQGGSDGAGSSASGSCPSTGFNDGSIPDVGVSLQSSTARAALERAGLNLRSDITYSYYPFLTIGNLSGVLPQDVNYLELQGCLRVPTREILDEFVQQYFLHVHPLLPLFDEGDFWELYGQQEAGSVVPERRMSLLVFQALLFAGCNFVSRNSICALGFPTIRAARAAFYRRAKLLFDFETEVSHAAAAQAAVLLTLWSPTGNAGAQNPNTAWLCTAIHQAKLAEAHRYVAVREASPPTTTWASSGADGAARHANMLKRLWWCCIIRDRIIGLCVRRTIQITRAHFDFEANPPLTRADLAGEMARSRVYNVDTKACLIEILIHLVDLCVVLTNILALVFPQDDSPCWGRQLADGDTGRIRQCKAALRSWYKNITLQSPVFAGGRSSSRSASSGSASTSGRTGSPATDIDSPGRMGHLAAARGRRREFCHDSIILYTNLIYMYYHSTRVVLCNYEILQIAITNTTGIRDEPMLYESCHELQDAATGVTECLKELTQLRLARWLPISAVACTALPLFLNILDVKLSAPNGGGHSHRSRHGAVTASTGADSVSDLTASGSSALKQHRLNILIEAMKTYQPQHDVDWISESIRHILSLTQLDCGKHSTGGGDTPVIHPPNAQAKPISDWTDILESNPYLYLRLALAIDLALRKNRLPEDRDFPVSLRGLFTNGGLISSSTSRSLSAAAASAASASTSTAVVEPISVPSSAGASNNTTPHASAPLRATVPHELLHRSPHLGNPTTAAAPATAVPPAPPDFTLAPHHLAMGMEPGMCDMDVDFGMVLDINHSGLATLGGSSGLGGLGRLVKHSPSSDEETSPPADAISLTSLSATSATSAAAPSPTAKMASYANAPTAVSDSDDAWMASWPDADLADRDTARALLEAMDDT